MLGQDSGVDVKKHGILHRMIVDQAAQSDVRLPLGVSHELRSTIDDRKRNLWKNELSNAGQLQLASGLSWLSLRTAFYLLAAQSSGMEAILHPIRHAFYLHLSEKLMGLPSDVMNPIVQMVSTGILATTREITKLSDPVISQRQIPVFSAYLATRTSDPREFLSVALHLREEGPFVEMRRQLQDLEDLVAEKKAQSYVREVNRIKRVIDGTSARLLSAYGVSTPQSAPIPGLTSVLNIPIKATTGLSIPDFGWKVPIPSGLTRIKDAYGFKAVFRSVVSDVVGIERLGKLHDIITSVVKRRGAAAQSGI